MGLRMTLLIIYSCTPLHNGLSQDELLLSSPLATLTIPLATSASSILSETTIPTDIPQIIAPPDGVLSAPLNTTLFKIGLTYGLNYNFVLDHPKLQQQIFRYLPMGIAYGMNSSLEKFTMQTLTAYDTLARLGYISTVARIWVPSELVAALNVGIVDASSQLYRNTDPSVHTILSMISPSLTSELLLSNYSPSGSTITVFMTSGTALPSISIALPSISTALPSISTALPSISTNSNIHSAKPSAKVKIIIGFLAPVGVLAILVFIVTFKYHKLRKNRALFSHPVDTVSDENSLPSILQQKPELDGEDHIHEMPAQERLRELHGEGRQELQGVEIQMELHGECRQRV